MGITFNGVNHLAMATGDMDRTIRFWRDFLGMRLVAGLGRPGYRHYFFEISPADMIAFFEWPGVEPIEERPHGAPRRGPFVFDHISFGVSTLDGLWQLKDKFDAAGIEVSDVIDHGFILSIYAHDPNGIPIEFSWSKDTADVRKHPIMADPGASDIAREGAEPQPGRWPADHPVVPPEERFIHPGAGSELFHGKK
jgi:catechol 2,3-dioxygenase-like lactoylglutathione lyase family enzyme